MINKDKNAHRFVFNAIRGELLERKRDTFGILYMGYLLSKRERKKEKSKLSLIASDKKCEK
jgi:hypothetical protein